MATRLKVKGAASPKPMIPRANAERGERLAGSYGYSATGVELAVNTETGELRVEKMSCSSDVGFPLNPKMCEQQVEGAMGRMTVS